VAKSLSDELGDVIQTLVDRTAQGVEDAKRYLATPEGQRVRKRIAQVAVVAAPLLFRSRFFTKTWPGRIIGLAGGAAAVVKLAEALRDWEPQLREAIEDAAS
jgi:hypothetical protein